MKKITFWFFFLLLNLVCFGQNKIEISGGIDFYYGINPLDVNQEKNPIFVSSNELNSTSINLGLIEFKFKPNKQSRFLITPAFGTYMNNNYGSEKSNTRWIYEGYIGFSPRTKTNEWIDVGIFSSPFTFETPKSWDQIAYTRSLAPELVPYYVNGIRYQNELSKNYKLSLFLLNGWQKIEIQKKIPSLGTQLEWRKNKEYINWTTYLGNEKTEYTPNLGFRFFSEVSWAHESEKLRTQACLYAGIQQVNDKGLKNWWQINGIIDYKLGQKSDIYLRYEYFYDCNKIQIQTPINAIGFKGHVSSLGFSHRVAEHMLFRLEGKTLLSKKENELFYFRNQYSNFLPLLFANITILF
jgi:hypothetical protein